MSYIATKLVAQARRAPLGSRQSLILSYARMRTAGGQPFPTPDECKAFLNYRGPAKDCFESILGLEIRGLIAKDGEGYFVTQEGWETR